MRCDPWFRHVRAIGFCWLVGLVSLVPVHPGFAEQPDAVAATVGGEPIKVREVLEFVHRVLAENQLNSQTRALVEAQALAQLIDRKLVSVALDRQEFKATPDEVDAALKKMEEQTAGQPGGLDAALASRGVSLDQFRRQLAWDVRWAKYLNHTLKETALRDYFNEHRRDFDGTELRVSHILLRPDADHSPAAVEALENKASEIRQQIVSGKLSFAEAAQKYSDGPSRREGGDLGLIPRHNRMVESFSAAAFKLDKGEISEPVITPYGVHLIQCTDLKPGDKSWEQARDQLAPVVAKLAFQRLADEMRANVKVEYTGAIPHVDPRTGRVVSAK